MFVSLSFFCLCCTHPLFANVFAIAHWPDQTRVGWKHHAQVSVRIALGRFQGRSKEIPGSPVSSAGAPRSPVSGTGSNEDATRMQRDPRSPIIRQAPQGLPSISSAVAPRKHHAHVCTRVAPGRLLGGPREIPRKIRGDPKVARQFGGHRKIMYQRDRFQEGCQETPRSPVSLACAL